MAMQIFAWVVFSIFISGFTMVLFQLFTFFNSKREDRSAGIFLGVVLFGLLVFIGVIFARSISVEERGKARLLDEPGMYYVYTADCEREKDMCNILAADEPDGAVRFYRTPKSNFSRTPQAGDVIRISDVHKLEYSVE